MGCSGRLFIRVVGKFLAMGTKAIPPSVSSLTSSRANENAMYSNALPIDSWGKGEGRVARMYVRRLTEGILGDRRINTEEMKRCCTLVMVAPCTENGGEKYHNQRAHRGNPTKMAPQMLMFRSLDACMHAGGHEELGQMVAIGKPVDLTHENMLTNINIALIGGPLPQQPGVSSQSQNPPPLR